MQHRKLLPGNQAGRILVRGLRRGDELQAFGGAIVAGIARDDALEILGIALRLHERLPAAARAARKIREPRLRAIKRGDGGLALYRRLVHRAIAEIDQLLGMAGSEARGVPRVPGVGRGGRVAAPQRRRQRRVLNEAVPAAVPDLLELAVPARNRQPDFALDIGIAGGSDGHGHAAKRRQIGERCVAFRRLELTRGNHLRRRDGGVRQLQRCEFPARSRIGAVRGARVNKPSRINGDIRRSADIRAPAEQNPERNDAAIFIASPRIHIRSYCLRHALARSRFRRYQAVIVAASRNLRRYARRVRNEPSERGRDDAWQDR